MKYFNASGLWFVDDDPDNQIAGTLSYSRRGLRLKLLGGFRDSWSPRTEPYPVIKGVVEKNPYGEFLTLIDCHTLRTKMSLSGIGTELIYCNRGFAGELHLDRGHDEFTALSMRTNYLDDWFNQSGITTRSLPGKGFAFDMSYRLPDPVHFRIGEMHLTLGTGATKTESSRRFRLLEESRLVLNPLPRMTSDAILSTFVRPLQNLLSFATDRSNVIDHLELRGQEADSGFVSQKKKYNYLSNPIIKAPRKKELIPDEILFTFDEASEAGVNIFDNWLSFSDKNQAFCVQYFAMLDAPSRYADLRFLHLTSAFNLLIASLNAITPRTKHYVESFEKISEDQFTEEECRLLNHTIPSPAEVEMPFFLLQILEENRDLMSRIIAEGFPGFVRSVSEAIAYAERRAGSAGITPANWGKNVYYLTEKLSFVVKILILRELGFDESWVVKLLEKNRRFAAIRLLES